MPFSYRVDSNSNFQYSRAQEDELIVEDLVLDPDTLTEDKLQWVRQVAMNEPGLKGRLVSDDMQATAVNVLVNIRGQPASAEQQAVEYTNTYVLGENALSVLVDPGKLADF
tara:strand:+ start:10204 stop:10536 length:333 start_codon:yes stop_codon:yes gene_type:complete